MNDFSELTLIVIISFIFASLMIFLKQPLLIGYIIAGILVGPYGFNIISSTETIELFSKLGITALLFIVGLNLSPKIIKDVGKISLITGLGQVIFTTLFGFLITRLLGFGIIEALYIAIALTFSSTIIILKLLSDKNDTQKLYGRIAVGFLLVQDIVATIILVIISSIASSENSGNVITQVSTLLAKGGVLLFVILLIAYKLLPSLTKTFAKSGELLFMFSLAWGIGIGLLYYELGLSIEIGALVAGVALSTTPYAHEIASRLKPLRDFFIVLFFINLGHNLSFTSIASLIFPTVVLSLFILIGNPIIVYLLMNLLGYTKKTGFLAGLTVAQISEFSLILIALGLSVNHVSTNGSSIITLVGIITIGASTYLIMYSDFIYEKMEWLLKLIEIKKNNKDKITSINQTEAILFGCHRVGLDFIKSLEDKKISFQVVDHDPNVVSALNKKNIPAVYGDASDIEFLDEIDINSAKIIISTIPDYTTNLFLVQHIKKYNANAIIIVIAQNVDESNKLYKTGADYVIMPHYLGANLAATMIQKFGFNRIKYKNERIRHKSYLKRRRELLS